MCMNILSDKTAEQSSKINPAITPRLWPPQPEMAERNRHFEDLDALQEYTHVKEMEGCDDTRYMYSRTSH